METRNTLISLRNVTFAYKNVSGKAQPVIHNLSLDVKQGELLAIQGPSGSGKSTLLYILGGLLRRYSGQVTFCGTDLARMTDQELAFIRNQQIGFVFQQFHLLPKATVFENILLPAQYPAEEKAKDGLSSRARELISSLGLGGRENHLPNQLSGGQQQRVAIARALLNGAKIILADEPTGSLDSKNSQQIMDLLCQINQDGRAVVIITHDPEIAKQCDRVIHFADGAIQSITINREPKLSLGAIPREGDVPAHKFAGSVGLPSDIISRVGRCWKMAKVLAPLALKNISQNRSRSFLTMIGIVIGVAAMLALTTLGTFTKQKMLESYSQMGVDTLVFYGYPNWQMKAVDQPPAFFQSFDWARDLVPLKTIFPEIESISPRLTAWNSKIAFAGKTIDSDVRAIGVSEDGLRMSNRRILAGSDLSVFHMESRHAVCVIGYEISKRFFENVSPVNQILFISQDRTSYGCRVIGVLAPVSSNKEWVKPNLEVYLPYTFVSGVMDPWSARIREVVIQVRPGNDVEVFGKRLKAFFQMKYGVSARFDVGSDSVLIAQMRKFMALFTVLLGSIAFVCLGVGGIGITNMMLVSVSERLKEIGIRKAVGATGMSIRVQYLLESVFLCALAGVIGLGVGFAVYQLTILGASKLVEKVSFEWIINWAALGLTMVSIFLVGVLSGLVPALKAENLEVIEALRAD